MTNCIINYDDFFLNVVDKIKIENRYRVFKKLSYQNRTAPIAYSSELQTDITVWCSNDYLGMSQHKDVVNSMIQTAQIFGAGAGGTRNIAGTTDIITELELEIADLHSKEAALVFTSGYVANLSTLGVLGKIIPDCVIFSDQDNHASIIQGILESKLTKEIFQHNDMLDLEAKLDNYPISRPKIIIIESVYSMSGNISELSKICALAKKYSALIYIDEVHSTGIYGARGAGIANLLGLEQEIDIIQGTLGKAFGVIGGYIAAKKEIIEAIKSLAPGFIFTTVLPAPVLSAALTSIKHLKTSIIERIEHKKIVDYVKILMSKYGLPYVQNTTHIIPVMIRDAKISTKISDDLFKEFGIYVQNINFPTVPRGEERLRITPNFGHTTKMAQDLVSAMNSIYKKYDLLIKLNQMRNKK